MARCRVPNKDSIEGLSSFSVARFRWRSCCLLSLLDGRASSKQHEQRHKQNDRSRLELKSHLHFVPSTVPDIFQRPALDFRYQIAFNRVSTSIFNSALQFSSPLNRPVPRLHRIDDVRG